MKKNITLMIAVAFLSSPIAATLASSSEQSFDSDNSLSLVTDSGSRIKLGFKPWNPELPYPENIDFFDPWGVIQCERNVQNTGAYVLVSPTTVRVDNVNGLEEYWVGVVAVDYDSERYAEVAIDVCYVIAESRWYTTAISIVSDGTWPIGMYNDSQSLGSSVIAPATAWAVVHQSSGNTWDFVVNGTAFHSIHLPLL